MCRSLWPDTPQLVADTPQLMTGTPQLMSLAPQLMTDTLRLVTNMPRLVADTQQLVIDAPQLMTVHTAARDRCAPALPCFCVILLLVLVCPFPSAQIYMSIHTCRPISIHSMRSQHNLECGHTLGWSTCAQTQGADGYLEALCQFHRSIDDA